MISKLSDKGHLATILKSDDAIKCQYQLPIVIGMDTDGAYKIEDLCQLPNLLISGDSGQGKTTCLNSIIASLLCKKQPSELKFILIDPKIIELEEYAKLNKSYICSS